MIKLNKLFLFVIINLLLVENVFSEKLFMWEVKSKTSTIFLLGSIHLGKESFYPLDRRIYNAFDRSEYLVVEANINKVDNNLIMSKAYLPKGKSIDSVVSKQNYEIIKNKFNEFKIPLSIWKNMKPWFAITMLTQLDLQKSGYNSQYGIDFHFLAKKEKEKILELESIEEQLNIFEKISEVANDEFIEYSLKELENNKNSVDSMYKAWSTGNIEMLSKIIKQEEIEDKNNDLLEELLYRRNDKMTAKIMEYLKTDKNYFIIVGAAHLIGDKGIITKLNKNVEYIIEQK